MKNQLWENEPAERKVQNRMAKTVKITTDNEIRQIELPSWDFEAWEKEIEADCTEIVITQKMRDLFKDSIVMIVDESGKLKNRQDNAIASYLYGAETHGCTIVGDVIFGVLRDADVQPPENPALLEFFLKDNFSKLYNEGKN